MSDNSLLGFGVEPQEVETILESLVGERDPGEDVTAWYLHLSSRQVLFAEVVKRLAARRATAVFDLYREMGDDASYAKVAERLGTTRARVQQMVEKGRAAEGQS